MKQNNMSMANSSMAGRLCRCRWTHVFRVPRACMAASLALAITWAFGGSINPNDYAKTSTITFSGYAGASTLTNFPALVKLDAGSVQGFDPADIQPNAADLRFTDSQFNELNYEIDTWDTNGALLIWVQIPELASNTLIRAFWDNASATTPAYTTNGATWANGYVAVWHFSETNGTTLADSVNGHNGTAAGGTVFSETGRIGSGGHFDGVDDTISVSNLAQLASQSQLTLSAWVKLDTLGSGEADDSCIFSQNDSTSPLVFWYNYTANTTGDKAYTFNVGPTSVLANRVNAGSGHVTSTWQHLAGVMLGTSRAIYIDGTFRGSATGAATTTGALTTGTIGSWEKLSNLAFDGALDEIRVANVARSADWVAAENATVSSSSFAEYGEVSEPDLSEIVFTAAPTVSVDSGNAISFSVDVASGEGSVYAIFDNGSSAITNLLGALTSTPTNFTMEVTGLTTNAYYTFSAYGVSQGASETSTAGSETLYIGAIWLEFIDNASEYGLVPGTVRVHRVNADDESLLVNYAFAGMTAVEGTNYEAPSGTATIQPGSSTVDIAVTPILDATTATDTTLSVNLATGYYLVGSPDSVEVVIENLETPAGKNVWVASAAGNASDAANWSQGVPQAGDDILLDLFSTADMTWDLDATNGLSASVASWTQTSNYTGTVSFPINYTHVAGAIFTNFTVTGNVSVEGGTWTHPANASTEDYRLFVTVGGNLTVASGASITATGKGYYNAGKNNGCHGGNANGVTGSTYGDPKYPTAIGACNSTSAGGGAILLDVSGAVVLNGAVTAAGVTAHESYGGAGGSILIDAPSISGTGSINANGAMGTKGDWYGYAGSGGRIALLTDGALAFPTNKVTAYGRMTGSTGAGSGAGTIFLKKTGDAHGTLIVANSTTGQTAPSSNNFKSFGKNAVTPVNSGETWTFDAVQTKGYGVLSVPVNTTLILPNGLASVSSLDTTTPVLDGLRYEGGTLDIGTFTTHTVAGGWCFQAAKPYTISGNLQVSGGASVGICRLRQVVASGYAGYYGCDLTVTGNMTVDADSFIEARYGGFWDYDATFPHVTHGGLSGFTTSAVATDSILDPYLPAGGREGNNNLYAGGGVVNLTVGGTLTLDGKASADGFQESGFVDLDIASPGGTFNFTVGSLAGNGSISAIGGINTRRMGTGGGRISVRLTDAGANFDTWRTKINAKGRTVNVSSSYAKSGSAGTVYLQTAEDSEGAGEIVIRNDDNANNMVQTPIPATGTGADATVDLKRASLALEDCGRAVLSADLKLASLGVETDSSIDLAGRTLIVSSMTNGEMKVPSGSYVAADFSSGVYDSSAETSGLLVVLGEATMIIVR